MQIYHTGSSAGAEKGQLPEEMPKQNISDIFRLNLLRELSGRLVRIPEPTLGTFAAEIQCLIHPVAPFDGFNPEEYPRDMQGGPCSPGMTHVFSAIQPRLLVEVGAWKGASACFWAGMMRRQKIDGAVLCIDTWLGGLEHLLWENEWSIRPYYRHGYPMLYYQFLANVMREGLQDYIVPLPAASLIGARWMKRKKLLADVVYIDGSHEEEDVYNDLREYWPALRRGGIICGDDFTPAWYGIICAVNRFLKEKEASLQIMGATWIIRKA